MKINAHDRILIIEGRLREALDSCKKARNGSANERDDHLQRVLREIDHAREIGTSILPS